MFSNGVCEIRFFSKSVKVGETRNAKGNSRDYEMVEVPFLEEPIKSSRHLDSEGFTVALESNKELSVAKSMKRTIDKIYDYANCNEWEWFCTFTFDDKKVDRSSFDDVVAKFSKWLNNMQNKYCNDMKYLVVPEKHKDGSYHFHGLFSNCDGLNFVPAINHQEEYRGHDNKYYMQELVRKGQQVFNIKRFKLGYSDCTQVKDTKKVANYVLKYITKELILDTPNKKRYWCSRNLDTPVEEDYLVPILDYEESLQEMLSVLLENKVDVYSNECVLNYGDFENKITYLKFDVKQGNLDIDSRFSVFSNERQSGPSRSAEKTGKKALDLFLEKNRR